MQFFIPINRKTEDKNYQTQSDTKFTQKIINIFVKNNQDKYLEIKNAIDTGDIKLAHRLTHTLKGNAGQLGRTSLQQIAYEMETSLKDGENLVTAEQLELLEKELKAAITEFMPLVQENEQNVFAEPADLPLYKEAALNLLEELEYLLGENNYECLAFTDTLKQIPGSEELIRHIDDLNFALAADTLIQLKQNLN